MSIKLKKINNTIIKCKKCPRLTSFIKKISIQKRKQNRERRRFWTGETPAAAPATPVSVCPWLRETAGEKPEEGR